MTAPAAAGVVAALPGGDDTIAALATPPGRGAVALLRVSGRDAFAVVGRVARPWPSSEDRVCALVTLRDPISGELLDRALVTRFGAPRSYTGEDVVELATHGGSAVPAAVLAALITAGARMALAGEFTRRAVLHGKMDLVQAEGIADLVESRTSAGRRVALSQVDGALSRRIEALREALLGVEALVAYDVDFPDEDDGPVPREHVLTECDRVLAAFSELARTAPAAALARDGATVVIAGAPNVGKSSLFNALLGTRRAIVAPDPGTTRDALDALLDTRPWPLRLVDTAGLRETSDVVERLGIEVSEEALAGADVVLCCGDDDRSLLAALERVRVLTSAPIVAVLTKQDLAPEGGGGSESMGVCVRVSAEQRTGLSTLLASVAEVLAAHGAVVTDGPLLTRARHRRAVEEACAELRDFRRVWAAAELPPVVAAVHLHAAVMALESLIGTLDVEAVLDRVFSTFCIGK